MQFRLVFGLSAVLLAMFAPMLPARACSCVEPHAADFLASSDVVFTGTVVDTSPSPNSSFELLYTFAVDTIYVGEFRSATITVRSGQGGGDCGYGQGAVEGVFGAPLGIAASVRDGFLSGSICEMVNVVDLEAAAVEAGVQARAPDLDVAVSTVATADTGDRLSESSRRVFIASGVVLVIVGLAVGYTIARRGVEASGPPRS